MFIKGHAIDIAACAAVEFAIWPMKYVSTKSCRDFSRFDKNIGIAIIAKALYSFFSYKSKFDLSLMPPKCAIFILILRCAPTRPAAPSFSSKVILHATPFSCMVFHNNCSSAYDMRTYCATAANQCRTQVPNLVLKRAFSRLGQRVCAFQSIRNVLQYPSGITREIIGR